MHHPREQISQAITLTEHVLEIPLIYFSFSKGKKVMERDGLMGNLLKVNINFRNGGASYKMRRASRFR